MPTVDIGMPNQGLYWDPEAHDGEGARISTHSMLKTFRRCPKQAQYKYNDRLKPKRLGSPLKRGTWVHTLLETHHNGDDWREPHEEMSRQFNQMFDEEKDYYGDMPTEIANIMRSYVWHYKEESWKVIDTEFQIEADFPDGTVYRGKVDAMVETPQGLFLVDHKTHKTLPDFQFRLLDAQSALYLWAALRNKIPVDGFIWNYVRWKEPSTPALLKDGSRLSKSACDTDYPTYRRALIKYRDENPQFKITQEYKDRLEYLKGLRYEAGAPQHSTFFRRDILEKSPEMLKRVAMENYHTSKRMHSYDFSQVDAVERVVDRGCTFSCSYTDLCAADLMGANTRPIIKNNYTTGDPNEYYNDKAGDVPEKE